MARVRRQTWQAILGVALVLLLVGLVMSGFVIWYFALFFLLFAMAGGALLYRFLGPPES